MTNRWHNAASIGFLLVFCLTGMTSIPLAASASTTEAGGISVFLANRLLGRGMNLGNALDAPSEGRWGVTLDESYFAAIADAGFDSIRLPVRWSAHASEHAPWTIEQTFLDRVAWAVDTALDHGLAVVLNVHHYERLMELPEVETDRFLAIWQQIAARFSQYPDLLMFELLNEPSHRLDAERWNALLWPTIERLRRSNPFRTLIVGPALFNHIRQLDTLSLPADDRHLIVTVHYYQPRQFTHQGASWQTGSAQWLGTTWHGSASERERIEGDLRAAARWAQHHGRPLYLGEFGVIREADPASRAAWTRFVARTAETLGYSWAYWEFASGFSVYDTGRREWEPDMLDALIPGSDPRVSTQRPRHRSPGPPGRASRTIPQIQQPGIRQDRKAP